MSLKLKLVTVFALLLLLTAAIIGYARYAIQHSAEYIISSGEFLQTTYDKPLMSSNYARDAMVSFLKACNFLDKNGYKKDEFEKLYSSITDDLDVVEERIIEPKSKPNLQKARELLEKWHASVVTGAPTASPVAPLDSNAIPAVTPPLSSTSNAKPENTIVNDIDQAIDLVVEGEFSAAHDFVISAQDKIVLSKEAVHRSNKLLLIFGAISIIMSFASGVYLFLSVLRPVRTCVSLSQSIASGKFDNTINFAGSTEFQQLLLGFQHMQDELAANMEKMKQSMLAMQQKDEHQQSLNQQATVLSGQIEQVVSELEGYGQVLSQVADEMATAIVASSLKVEEVAGASEQSSAMSQGIAAACEEMASSIHKITGQMDTTSQVVKVAVGITEQATVISIELQTAMQGILSVTNLIESITDQINLLALNATIEAARAGDAGKGFAVVAGEVKSLALQTVEATKEISAQIQKIENTSSKVFSVFADIKGTVSKVSEYSDSVAASVQEQGMTTAEIAKSMTHSLEAANQVKHSLKDIKKTSEQVQSCSEKVQQVSSLLRANTQTLNSSFDKFLQSTTIT